MADFSRDRAQGFIRACYGVETDVGVLADRLLHSLRRAVGFDAAFFATADPDSLLFTSALAEEPLVSSAALFLDNEFGKSSDFNRFADLSRSATAVGSLDQATGGVRSASQRWVQILDPLGLGDELRVALRVDGTTWGFLCLHRSGRSGFSPTELSLAAKLAQHAGAALRRFVASNDRPSDADDRRTVILVGHQVIHAVAGVTDQLGLGPLVPGNPLPLPLAAVVRRLEAIDGVGGAELPAAAVRIVTPDGTVMAVHAARLRASDGFGPVVLTIAPATTLERSSLLLAAHGLTPAQRRVARLVLQGRTTAEIVLELQISAYTVQDHLKAVFDKVGVRSRRELVGSLMNRPS